MERRSSILGSNSIHGACDESKHMCWPVLHALYSDVLGRFRRQLWETHLNALNCLVQSSLPAHDVV